MSYAESVTRQLRVLGEFEQQEQSRLRSAFQIAQQTLTAAHAFWNQHLEDTVRPSVHWLIARPLEDPTQTYEVPARPSPITVVATDGSQIFPDRHFEPYCYLLSVSRIAFQYGTLEPPLMETDVRVHGRGDAIGAGDLYSADLISARRDELELRTLLETAQESHRPGRPLVSMADGTLIRWMLHRLDPPEVKEAFIVRYVAQMRAFREAQLPVCSFISSPNATEVVNLLRAWRQEGPQDADTLQGLTDRGVFGVRLSAGSRTAVFESASHIMERLDAQDRICFFYVEVDKDVARIELPQWVACRKELLNRVHALVVSECNKGRGYPVVLTEAHERAVIRRSDREMFYRLVEREMERRGLGSNYSRKAQTKRRPAI